MDKKDFDIDEIPKVEVYEDEVEKRKSSFSTWVLIAIILLGGYYLWSTDVNASGSSTMDITDAELEKQVDHILEELEKEEVPVETDSNMIIKEFVEGDLVSFPHLEAVDPEGQPVSYSFTYPLDSDGEWQTKKGDAGEYLVTVTASDGVNSADQNVLIVVKANTDNSLPVLKLEKTEFYVKEGETLNIKTVVNDADGDTVNVSFEGWMDSDTRLVGFDEEGTHTVIVSASDGKVSVKQEVTVFVENVNQAPILGDVKQLVWTEGDLVVFDVEVSDPDNDKVSLAYNNLFSSNDNTWQTKKGDAGEYLVTVTASDGKLSKSKEYTLKIEHLNQAPLINFVDTVEVNEGEPVILEPVVSDPENDNVSLSYSGWMDSNFKETDYDSAGTYEVKIVASDGKIDSVKTVTVIVRDVNRMPVFNAGAFN